MKSSLLFLLALFSSIIHFGQVQGTIKNLQQEPLPFASIYVKGTSLGTTSNLEGEFFLKLAKGRYDLVFQYVGYQSLTKSIEVTEQALLLAITLNEESVDLTAIEIKANTEDPAYPIIRKAIAKRKYYQELVKEYACDVYVKGNMKMLDAPEKILGQEVGDLEGNLDTTRQGIIYLSESESQLNFRAPNEYREIMVSSKVSGDNQGFSFNNAMSMDIDFYGNTTYMSRNIVSPIANTAFSYYKYKLHGTIYDDDGRLINKIEVIPKQEEAPIIQGFIYIVEDLWLFQSVDVYLTGKSAHTPFFDTLFIKQVYVPIEAPDVWRAFSRSFRFGGGFFGFRYQGNFVGVYRNYNLQPAFPDDFFSNEILKVEEDANEKDSTYWEIARPVPLTAEETVDYVVKDSIKEVRQSKVFLDSLDKVKNKFKFNDLFTGYTYDRSYQKKHYAISSPLTTIQFNPAQGWNADIDLKYEQEFDDDFLKWLDLRTRINYGFGDKQLRVSGRFRYNFNRTNFARLTIEGGHQAAQYNPNRPITPTLNSLWSLFFRRNYMNLYDKKFIRLQYRQEVFNGVLLQAYVDYANRNNLANESDFSYFYKDSRDYFPNLPQNPHASDGAFESSKALTMSLAIRLRWKQQYLNYPKQKFITGSKLPDLWLRYRKGVAFNRDATNGLQSQVDYDLLVIQLQENYLSYGTLGYAAFFIEGGIFLNQNALFFQDYRHFNGNQIEIGNPFRYNFSFLALPYFTYSSQKQFFQTHYQHHLDGWLMDKVPLLRKLQWTTVLGAHFLYTNEQKDYLELTAGFDNIGFKLFRFLRFDVVASFQEGKYQSLGWVIGIKTP